MELSGGKLRLDLDLKMALDQLHLELHLDLALLQVVLDPPTLLVQLNPWVLCTLAADGRKVGQKHGTERTRRGARLAIGSVPLEGKLGLHPYLALLVGLDMK